MRLFFAIELNSIIRHEIALLVQNIAAAIDTTNIRWLPPENWHVTLKFIGECDPLQIPNLIASVTKSLQQISAFSLQLENLNLFPTPSHPQVLVLTLSPQPALFQLADKIEQAAISAGFSGENRPYFPHLSLARFKHPPQLNLAHVASHPKHEFLVDHFVLMSSKQEGSRRVYEVLQKFSLAVN